MMVIKKSVEKWVVTEEPVVVIELSPEAATELSCIQGGLDVRDFPHLHAAINGQLSVEHPLFSAKVSRAYRYDEKAISAAAARNREAMSKT